MKKIKDIVLFVSIFLVLSLVAGGTYAYFGWRSATNKSVVFNTTKELQEYVVYNEGDSHFIGDFQPVANFCDSTSNTLSIKLNTERMSQQELLQMNKGLLVFSIKMDVNYIGQNTAASPNVHWVVTSGNKDACPRNLSYALAHGTFQGVSSGDTITVLENDVDGNTTTITDIEKEYTVWVWIDSSGSNSALSGETIDVNIWSQIDMLDPSLKTSAVMISGNNTIKSDGTGNVLTAVFDDVAYDPNDTYTYQWYSNTEYSTTGGTPISGATMSTFTLTNQQVGKYIYVEATSLKGKKFTTLANNDNVSQKTKVEVAIPNNNLCVSATYNGSVQRLTSVTSGTGYTLSNYNQTNAGTYSIMATLADNYIWSDYTNTVKSFNCSISKITPVITLSSTSTSITINKSSTFTATVKSGVSNLNVTGTLAISSLSPEIATVSPETTTISNANNSTGISTTATILGLANGTATVTLSFIPNDTANYVTTNATYVASVSGLYKITYYLGNGTSDAGNTKLGTSTCYYGQDCVLTSFSDLGGIFPYSSDDETANGKTNYSWTFYGWGTSETATSRTYANSATFTYSSTSDMNLYAIGRKRFYINTGIAPTDSLTTFYQYWNPYSTSTAYLTSITLPEPTPISGWTFVGYKGGSNTANGTVTFEPSEINVVITPSYNTYGRARSIYKRSLVVSYSGNGSTGGSTTSSTVTQYYNSGYGSSGTNNGSNVSTATFTLASNGFTKTGYNFNKWNTASDGSGTGYAAGANYTWAPSVDATTLTRTLYATWNIKTYAVSYNACSGSGIPSSQTKTHGTNLTLSSSTPTRSGYIFKGYSTASCSGTVAYQPGGTYSTNSTATMYAVWEAGTTVNAERWNIKAIDSYNRVTKYYITVCGSSSCTYSKINGITSSYASTYAFSSSVTSTGKTPSPISTSVPGIGSDYKPTWSVASSALQYTSTSAVRQSGKFNTAKAATYLVCYDIASTTGTPKAEWATGTNIASIRSTFKYNNSGTNWWYRAEDNCFFRGEVNL